MGTATAAVGGDPCGAPPSSSWSAATPPRRGSGGRGRGGSAVSSPWRLCGPPSTSMPASPSLLPAAPVVSSSAATVATSYAVPAVALWRRRRRCRASSWASAAPLLPLVAPAAALRGFGAPPVAHAVCAAPSACGGGRGEGGLVAGAAAAGADASAAGAGVRLLSRRLGWRRGGGGRASSASGALARLDAAAGCFSASTSESARPEALVARRIWDASGWGQLGTARVRRQPCLASSRCRRLICKSGRQMLRRNQAAMRPGRRCRC